MTENKNNDFLIKFNKNCQIYADKLAIVSNEEKVSYQDFFAKVYKFQQSLKEPLFSNQKLIAIDFTNSVDSIALFMATILLCKVPVLIDPNWSQSQLTSIISRYSISCFISARNFDPCLITKFAFHKTRLHNFFVYYKTIATQINLLNSTLFIAFTSGTTNLPKAFSLNKKSWDESFIASSKVFGLNTNSVILSPGQIIHGLTFYPIIESFVNGSTVIINSKFDSNYIINCITKFSNISLVVAPIMITKIYSECSSLLSGYQSVKQIITAGSAIDQKFLNSCFSLFPRCRIREYYGASEIGFVGYREIEKDNFKNLNPFSVFPGVSIRVIKNKTISSNLSKVGTIWIKSPYISNGYLETHTGGFKKVGKWASVGDQVLLNSNSCFFLKGREGDMVISGGKNVYLSEIENFFKQIKCIEEVAIFSINDRYWGDKICAVISFVKEEKLSKEQLKLVFVEKHEAYKFPKSIFYCTKLPRTSSGKINVGKLKEAIFKVDNNCLIEL